MKDLATDAKLVYDKAVATYDYTVAYLDLYREAEDKGWDLGLMSLNDTINATTGLSGDLWGECQTFNTSLFGSARNDNTLSQLLGASSAGLSNGVTLDKALASNYGQYQIDWRQEAGLDTTWATNVKSARDAYFTALGGAATDFDTTLIGAVQGYHDTMLEAQITRSQSHFDAQKTLYLALEAAGNTYAVASFLAAKDASLGYLDNAIDEIDGNWEVEIPLLKIEWKHYEEIAQEWDQKLSTALTNVALAAAKELYIIEKVLVVMPDGSTQVQLVKTLIPFSGAGASLASVANGATATYNTTKAAKPARDAAAKKAISDAKTANAAVRKTKDALVAIAYTKAENNAWNTYYVAALTAEKVYVTTYVNIEKTFNNTKEAAESTYTNMVVPAATAYEKELCRLQGLFQDAVGQANLGYGVDANYYAYGTSSTNVQVCFAAGYEIELTDGSKKKIEDFDGTEEIWARPHDNPDGSLQKCKVVRAFKNGVKETMLVYFNNGLELRGTSEHPFYVAEKGWTPLGKLVIGDICYDREQKPVVVTEIIRDNKQVEVYNIEVENCHTYYIGKGDLEVLVHNLCSKCHTVYHNINSCICECHYPSGYPIHVVAEHTYGMTGQQVIQVERLQAYGITRYERHNDLNSFMPNDSINVPRHVYTITPQEAYWGWFYGTHNGPVTYPPPSLMSDSLSQHEEIQKLKEDLKTKLIRGAAQHELFSEGFKNDIEKMSHPNYTLNPTFEDEWKLKEFPVPKTPDRFLKDNGILFQPGLSSSTDFVEAGIGSFRYTWKVDPDSITIKDNKRVVTVYVTVFNRTGLASGTGPIKQFTGFNTKWLDHKNPHIFGSVLDQTFHLKFTIEF